MQRGERWVIFGVLAAVLLLLAVFHRSPNRQVEAVVTVDGTEILRLPLTGHTGTERIFLEEDYHVPVSLEIEGERIRFIEVTCPDHICEKAGWIGEEYQSAVCMPNRTAVSIYPIER